MHTCYKGFHFLGMPLKLTCMGVKTLSTFNGLDKIKVLDLTRIVAGPFCTMILSDLGAQIYKVESPGQGDECRNWPPYIGDAKNKISCYFASVNRNKKSICINLKSERGKEIIYDLAKNCDVLVENYVPGKLDKMGLGYETLKKIAPQLIYCSVTGYGPKGPYKTRPGYDVIAASVGGMVHITGPEDGAPCKPGVAMTDIATGLYAHGAILAALLNRTHTGKGQKIDCNLLSTQIACLINLGSNYLNVGIEAKRWGTAHASIVPYESFPTSDGYITVGTGSNGKFLDLCSRLKIPDVAQDLKYETNALRVQNRSELINKLRNIFSKKTSEDWMKIFEGATFPCGPVNNLSRVSFGTQS
jgi:succinate--hydroxymethylglutarate CoA-transferase